MVDDLGVCREFVDEVRVGDRSVDGFIRAAGTSSGVTTGRNVAILEAEVVVRFEVIEDGNGVTFVRKSFGEMSTNEPRTACDQDLYIRMETRQFTGT